MTDYNFVEIGTSDFDTELQKYAHRCPPHNLTNETIIGLSVEPIKFYLDRLPDHPAVIKANLAVSNKSGTTTVHYVTPENIKKYSLPEWVRGCNSIGAPHPTVSRLIGNKDIVVKEEIEVVDWPTLVQRYQIRSIDYLKIDTEGHDTVILNAYMDYLAQEGSHPPARRIFFESNVLTPAATITETIKRLETFGYQLKYRNDNTYMVLAGPN